MEKEIYNEDCLVTMSRMEDNSIDLVFADYPFNCQDGKKDYIQFVEETASEFFRILKDGGNLVVVNNPSNHFKTLPSFSSRFFMRNKIALLRKAAFFPAWHFGFAHNDAYILVKGKDMKFKWNGNRINHAKFQKDFLEYQNGSRTKSGWHPQAMPLALVKEWVEYLSDVGDIVYDPFTGSGTTLLACEGTRRFIGSEYSEKYYDMIVNRMQ